MGGDVCRYLSGFRSFWIWFPIFFSPLFSLEEIAQRDQFDGKSSIKTTPRLAKSGSQQDCLQIQFFQTFK